MKAEFVAQCGACVGTSWGAKPCVSNKHSVFKGCWEVRGGIIDMI